MLAICFSCNKGLSFFAVPIFFTKGPGSNHVNIVISIIAEW